MTMYRQGDVLIVSGSDDPVGDRKLVKRDIGRVILAYGEATGHAHAIADRGAKLYEVEDRSPSGDDTWARANRILRVSAKAGVELRHEEHSTIPLPKGDYQIIHQREYSPKEIRRVID